MELFHENIILLAFMLRTYIMYIVDNLGYCTLLALKK